MLGFGDKVESENFEGVAVIIEVDESDSTYKVFIEKECEWEWFAFGDVRPYKAPAAQGTAQKTSGLVDLFGMPLGRRMQYDNSSARRKDQPVTEGFLDYFPATARLTAELSRLGNEKHNPGEPLHHARDKSKDHRNCAVRHLMDADVIDPESGLVEAVGAVWRSSAYVQELAENVYGWPKAPRAR